MVYILLTSLLHKWCIVYFTIRSSNIYLLIFFFQSREFKEFPSYEWTKVKTFCKHQITSCFKLISISSYFMYLTPKRIDDWIDEGKHYLLCDITNAFKKLVFLCKYGIRLRDWGISGYIENNLLGKNWFTLFCGPSMLPSK